MDWLESIILPIINARWQLSLAISTVTHAVDGNMAIDAGLSAEAERSFPFSRIRWFEQVSVPLTAQLANSVLEFANTSAMAG